MTDDDFEDTYASFLGRPRRFATPDQLSPEARALYESSVERTGEKQSRIWLEYRDHYILDEDLNAVEAPFVEWAVMYEKRSERQIRLDRIGNWFISTVFMGLDHGFPMYPYDAATYRPLLWETMVFYEPVMRAKWRSAMGGRRRYRGYPFPHEHQRRYYSTQEAIAGHAAVVALVQTLRRGPRKLKKLLRQRWDAKRSSGNTLARRYAGALRKFDL